MDLGNFEDFRQYDLHDLMFDSPSLFSRIINEAIDAYDGYGFDLKRDWDYKTELATITATQWEVLGGQTTQQKTNRYDHEVQKIKNDLMWAGIQTTDSVEVVFWQDSFEPLVSFARKTKRLTMMTMLDTQYDDMREAGFSYDFISKTSLVLRAWAEKLLNPDDNTFKQDKSALRENSDIVSDLFSLFYNEDDDMTERGEDDVK